MSNEKHFLIALKSTNAVIFSELGPISFKKCLTKEKIINTLFHLKKYLEH